VNVWNGLRWLRIASDGELLLILVIFPPFELLFNFLDRPCTMKLLTSLFSQAFTSLNNTCPPEELRTTGKGRRNLLVISLLTSQSKNLFWSIDDWWHIKILKSYYFHTAVIIAVYSELHCAYYTSQINCSRVWCDKTFTCLSKSNLWLPGLVSHEDPRTGL
jgi:hypothetical protein